MIRTPREREAALRLLEDNRRVARAQTAGFRAEGLDTEQIRQLLQPLQYFHEQLRAEIEEYDDALAGNVAPLYGVSELGRYLVHARLAAGISQRELARRLDVDESVVSHDERN